MNTTQNQIKYASLGSVSTGTLRTEDLLDALGRELERQIGRNGQYFSQPENFAERDRLAALLGEWQDCAEDSEDADGIVSDLADALGVFAAPYCYFGTHYGDGADFGFWPLHDEIEELPLVEGSDEARELGEDCRSVNDHGNVTVYGGDGSVILEIV